ncbi:MAG TPA: nicotinate phosphoribosyltransferase [Methanocorpusculum sp.]|nr:nicotinate phosphoribosyltransferase [Methanocorpusculum sp.]
MNNKRNLAMICDFYEFTMGNGYFLSGFKDKITVFDVFFRSVPDGAGFAIAAGLEQVIRYVEDLHFDDDDIAYFRSKNLFDEKFLEYLRGFRFTGDIYAVPEGTPVFPNEPILIVRAPAPQAQILETFILLTLNHQSLIATKASRVCRAALGRAVLEFGSRRAQGGDAAVLGARAAYLGGCAGTACTLTDEQYAVPAGGTMAHSWVQMFDSEYEAFRTYCEIYPTNAVLLVDTYNVIKSGVPNAIRAIKDVLIPKGITHFGIRLDSGDMAYLSKRARKMLDEAGLSGCKIYVSNSLDEFSITALMAEGAPVDVFGVGERMITASSNPIFGCVYKLAAVEENGMIVPKIKISEDAVKVTNPHFKKVYRLIDNTSGKAVADLLCVFDEVIDEKKPLTIFDPMSSWKTSTLENFTARELLVPIFKAGTLVYDVPKISDVKAYCAKELDGIWDEVKRFDNPHRYYVDLSEKLWNIKKELIHTMADKIRKL